MSQSEGQTFFGSVVEHFVSTLKGVAVLAVVLGGYFVVRDTWIWCKNPAPTEVDFQRFLESPPPGEWFLLTNCRVRGEERLVLDVPDTDSELHAEVFVPIRPAGVPVEIPRAFARVSKHGDARAARCLPVPGKPDYADSATSLVVYIPSTWYRSEDIQAALSSHAGAPPNAALYDATSGPRPPWRNWATWSVAQGLAILGGFAIWRRYRSMPAPTAPPPPPGPPRDPDAIVPRG